MSRMNDSITDGLEDEFPILAELDAENVFYISRNGDSYTVAEACDDHFGLKMTREKLLMLAEEINRAANL